MSRLAMTSTDEIDFSESEASALSEDDEADYDSTMIDLPDERQDESWTCGAAAVVSVARYFDIEPDTESEAITLLGTSPSAGTPPDEIVRVLEAHGLTCEHHDWFDLDGVKRHLDEGHPVIVPVQMYGSQDEYDADASGHWVVIIGDGAGELYLQDPVSGRISMDEDEFKRRWHDREDDGTPYERYGIAVWDDGQPDEAEQDAEGKEAKLGGLVEADDLDEAARKQGFTGEKRDSLGRRRCYRNGKPVPCPKVEKKGKDDGARQKNEAALKKQMHERYAGFLNAAKRKDASQFLGSGLEEMPGTVAMAGRHAGIPADKVFADMLGVMDRDLALAGMAEEFPQWKPKAKPDRSAPQGIDLAKLKSGKPTIKTETLSNNGTRQVVTIAHPGMLGADGLQHLLDNGFVREWNSSGTWLGPTAPGKPNLVSVKERIRFAGGPFGTAADIKAVTADLKQLTVKDLTALKKDLGIKGGRLKAELAAKIADHLSKRGGPAAGFAAKRAELLKRRAELLKQYGPDAGDEGDLPAAKRDDAPAAPPKPKEKLNLTPAQRKRLEQVRAERGGTAAVPGVQTVPAPSAPETARADTIDTPAQGDLNDARRRKAAAFKRVKELRQQIKDEPIGGNRRGLRLELMKATNAHQEAIALERGALAQIEKRANELGKTTAGTPKTPVDKPAERGTVAGPKTKEKAMPATVKQWSGPLQDIPDPRKAYFQNGKVVISDTPPPRNDAGIADQSSGYVAKLGQKPGWGANQASALANESPKGDSTAERIKNFAAEWYRRRIPSGIALPVVFHHLRQADKSLSVQQFHDTIKALHDGGDVLMSGWSGPLTDMPVPDLATFHGHKVHYYLRTAQDA